MTGQTKTTSEKQPGPTRAPQKDQAEGSPEAVDRQLDRSGSGQDKGSQSGAGTGK